MIEVLKQALEALEKNYKLINGEGTRFGLEGAMDGYYSGCFDVDGTNKETENAITSLRQAIAGLESQEPVAWISPSGALYRTRYHAVANAEQSLTPLFTHPQRTWVGLTDEERQDIALEVPMDAVLITEAKLKQLNT
jgi:hypothetical protein